MAQFGTLVLLDGNADVQRETGAGKMFLDTGKVKGY